MLRRFSKYSLMLSTIGKYSRLVALPHSVFALPFALSAFLLAANKNLRESFLQQGSLSLPPLTILILVVAAGVAMRTAAMAFNRLIDAEIDKKNPRTAMRELPSGQLSRSSVLKLLTFSLIVFFTAAGVLGTHCLVLSPIVVIVLFGYSYTKRFTSYSHLLLGLSLGLAPAAAWWVLRPQVELTPILLMFGVLFWVAGFDVLYSCQDVAFDKKEGLYSIPARLGVERGFVAARIFHALSFVLFVSVGFVESLPVVYFIGIALLSVLLLVQHALISPSDLSRINHAFFTLNGMLSIGFFLLVVYCLP